MDSCESSSEAEKRPIAFIEDSAVWLGRVDGGKAGRVTRSAYATESPAVQPGGDRIIFALTRGPEADVNVLSIRRDGRDESMVARDVGQSVSDPSWSPSGDRIAYIKDVWLTVSDADGGNARRLAPDIYANSPTWSPDGQWIAFGGAREDSFQFSSDIWVVRPDGSELRRVTDTPAESEANPTWSPDGRLIAYNHDQLTPGIWLIRSDGHGRRQLTDGQDSEPTWASDCRTIAFARARQHYSLRTVSLRGHGQIVRAGLRNHPMPEWSQPAAVERGDPPQLALPPAHPAEPLRARTHEQLVNGARRLCTRVARTLQAAGPPRSLKAVRSWTPQVRVAVIEARTELAELGRGLADDTFRDLLTFWDVEIEQLNLIQMLIGRGHDFRASVWETDPSMRQARSRTHFVLEDCRRTDLPPLAPLVGDFRIESGNRR